MLVEIDLLRPVIRRYSTGDVWGTLPWVRTHGHNEASLTR
jgi:hypothetical protein